MAYCNLEASCAELGHTNESVWEGGAGAGAGGGPAFADQTLELQWCPTQSVEPSTAFPAM